MCCAMRSVEPEVFLVARPKVDYEAMAAYLREVGGEFVLRRERRPVDALELLVLLIAAVIRAGDREQFERLQLR